MAPTSQPTSDKVESLRSPHTSIHDAELGNQYDGSGTEDDPYVVEFTQGDMSNPMNWSDARKWWITSIATLSVFVVTFASSAYAESYVEIDRQFHPSDEVFTLGVSLFVLGFAIGPAFWGPLHRSELYGRQILWVVSHIAMTGFIGGSAGSNSMATLIILRLFAGIFGGSPLVNSGGCIADLFPPAQRGLAMTLYCIAPFLGPVLGPVVGGFVLENIGWRWVQGICGIMIAVIGIIGVIFIPETYGPVLLVNKAKSLEKTHNAKFVSVLVKSQGKKKASEVFKRALVRPWVFLFREPIVFVGAIYMAIIYGIVYMFLAAFPIVYNTERGWSEGIGGLAFMGITVGILLGLAYAIWDNKRYARLLQEKKATAESRLPPAILGAFALPIGMMAFAWTNYPSIHWSVSIIVSAPFGFGAVLVILPVINYLIDSYTIYAASVLTAAAILRCLFGFAFPLFTNQMYAGIGTHWASALPAFIMILLLPFPLVMYRYGATVRMKCKYSHEAAELMARMQAQQRAQAKAAEPTAAGKEEEEKA